MSTPLRIRAIRVVVIAVVLQAVYVTFFVLPGHEPKPNGLPVGVVAELTAFGGPEGLDLVRVDDAAAARRAIRDREVYGAFTPEGVLVSTAASVPVAEMLRSAAGELPVTDVRPVDRDDPRGTTLNLFVLPLIVSGILIALVAGGAVPDLDLRGRVLLTAAAAFAGSLVTVGIVHGLIGALPGPWLALVGTTALGVLSLALPASGLVALMGPAGVGVAFVLFLVLGSPASGLASAPELLPTPWAQAGHLLPPGALGTAIRGTAYFDGAGALGGCLVLLAWAGVGLLLLGVASRRRHAEGRPSPAHDAAPAPAG